MVMRITSTIEMVEPSITSNLSLYPNVDVDKTVEFIDCQVYIRLNTGRGIVPENNVSNNVSFGWSPIWFRY